MFNTILVSVDGSDSANRAAEFGAELASYYDAHLDIVHVLPTKLSRTTRTNTLPTSS